MIIFIRMKTTQDRSVDLPLVVTLCLVVVVVPLAFLTSAFDVFGTIKYASLLLLAVVALGIMALQTAASGSLRLPTGWTARLLGAFLTWLALSTFFSPVPLISFFGLRQSLIGLITYLAVAVLLIAAARINWDRKKLRALFYSVSFTATATSLAGIAQYLGATFPLDLKSLFSQAAYSTFGNPTFLGSFLALTVPISLYLSMDGQSAEDKLIGYMSGPFCYLFVGLRAGGDYRRGCFFCRALPAKQYRTLKICSDCCDYYHSGLASLGVGDSRGKQSHPATPVGLVDEFPGLHRPVIFVRRNRRFGTPISRMSSNHCTPNSFSAFAGFHNIF